MNDLEKNLLEHIRKDDEKAFEILFKSFYSDLVKYASGIVGNLTEAEDLVEEAFFWIWENRKMMKIEKSLKGYLFTIVYHRSVNHLEKVKRHQHYLEAENVLKKNSVSNDVSSQLLEQEIQMKIARAIDELPQECKKIFTLNRFDGMKYREIAEKLNISINTVKTQMSRALAKIKEDLSDYL